MSLLTGGLHHLTIRTTDLARAKRFYVDTMGFEVVRERDGALILNAHGTTFGVLGAAPQTASQDRFDPFRVGLDHLALAVETPRRWTGSNSNWTLPVFATTVCRTTRAPAPGTSRSTIRMALPGSCMRRAVPSDTET